MKSSTETNVPELRFPEFEGEWSNFIIKNISTKVTDGTHSTPKTQSNGLPYITAIHVKDGNIDFKNCYYLSEKDHKEIYNRCNPEYGDILMVNIGAGTATVSRVNVEYEFSLKNVALIKPDKNIVDSYFLAQIQREKSKRLKHQLASGGAQPFLSLKAIKKLKLSLPQLPEQQKIADFLSQVDRKIDLLQQKVTALAQYKKGVMQQLFPSASSGQVPQLRFKRGLSGAEGQDDGSDYPEWEEKKLGEILNYYDGTHQTPKYVSEGIPFYSVEHITSNQFTKTKYISEKVFEKENKRVKLERGDILMTRIGDIGTSRLIDWDVKASFYVSLALLKQNESFNSGYLNQYISSLIFQKELWRRTIHVAFPKKINLGEIGNCKVKMPSLIEQTKIANFLSSIDQKIAHTQEQLEQTKSFKKGLLQKMFV
ncbi:restriction endonuclease subunit S [Psychroflexus salis]|uniref:Specificity determinant HsdS n=1 Tax=Psychroflexus salis TaxID=1526574 RepID=A0A917A2X9_9FLAO|nr:restriction endonuclease subunit S [Psychroflexus salis]GGE21601.1 specificity determinant HsdS [Psychroflexus salis]